MSTVTIIEENETVTVTEETIALVSVGIAGPRGPRGSTLRIIGWVLPDTLEAGADVAHNPIIEANSTLTGVRIFCKTAPSGSAAVFDVLRSTDDGVTFASIFTTRPTVADGSKVGGSDAVFASTVAHAGDVFRIDVIDAGSIPAADITFEVTSELT